MAVVAVIHVIMEEHAWRRGAISTIANAQRVIQETGVKVWV